VLYRPRRLLRSEHAEGVAATATAAGTDLLSNKPYLLYLLVCLFISKQANKYRGLKVGNKQV